MADSDPLCLTQQIPNNPIKKRKNDSRYEEEIEFSNNWSRFIVLKSSEGCIPLTKLSPFVIEKCIPKNKNAAQSEQIQIPSRKS
jgi:hypothetical protein